MTTSPDRESFIPLRVRNLVELLRNDTGPTRTQRMSESEQAAFLKFADAVIGYVHHQYLTRLKKLKADYDPFDPDIDLFAPAPAEDDRRQKLNDLFDQFAHLLQQADYRRLSREELEEIMRGASQWGVDMRVEWEAFEKLDVYVRGQTTGTRTVRKWYRMFRQHDVTVPTFSRVVIILKQQPHKALGKGADTQNVFLKLFKDIPRMDVEMLLPGTRIRMAWADRLRLGGSGVGSLGYVLFKLSSMFAPFLKAIGLVTAGAVAGEEGIVAVLAFYAPLALIGGYAYKTYASYSTTRRTYQLQLSQSLYYQNLDNNAGVLFRLLDSAEEQETREVLLAYFFLWRYAGAGGWTAGELDQYVELELARRLNVDLDFDVDDAVAKLERAGLVERTGDRLRAVPATDALARLDDIWDDTSPDPSRPLLRPAAVG